MADERKVNQMWTMLIVSAMLATATPLPKVAIIAAQDKPSELTATVLQAALKNVKIIDRRILDRLQVENILNGKAMHNVGVDFLITVETQFMWARGTFFRALFIGSPAYNVSTIIEVINPATAEIVKTIVTTALASQLEIEARMQVSSTIPLDFLFFKKAKSLTDAVDKVIKELNSVLTLTDVTESQCQPLSY